MGRFALSAPRLHLTHAAEPSAPPQTLPGTLAAHPATHAANTYMATAAASQDIEADWSVGGVSLVVERGRSEPPCHLALPTPGQGAEENKRPRLGPEYPLHEHSTSRLHRSRHPYLNTATTQTPHPTVTASVDGPVGYASLELAVLACPRSTRCLYVIKTLDVWKKSICRPRGVGPGGRRGAKERITI